MKKSAVILLVLAASLFAAACSVPAQNETQETTQTNETTNTTDEMMYNEDDLREIYLAGGCFWGLEEYYSRIDGVVDATVGYANGNTENPTYEEVCFQNTGHAETVHVTYDNSVISLTEILKYYFRVGDPTSLNKQGNDVGTQYRSGIYYVDKNDRQVILYTLESEAAKHDKALVVEVQPLDGYYLAEEYHQDYLQKNPNGYCHIDLGEADVPLKMPVLKTEGIMIDESK